jgi:hypothetical protein
MTPEDEMRNPIGTDAMLAASAREAGRQEAARIESGATPVGIGSTIWVFDKNNRVYAPPERGRIWVSGGPIWREHWRPVRIVAETSRSWVLESGGTKVPKKGASPSLFAFSQAEVDDQVWVHDNKYRISTEVERLTSPALLRKVAALISYKPSETP